MPAARREEGGMEAKRGLDIQLRDSAFEPGGPSGEAIRVDVAEGRRARYKVWLYLEGRDLPYVRSVTYYLPNDFPDPVRAVPRTPQNPYCKLAVWAWTYFSVTADVEDRSGHVTRLVHSLQYGQDLTEKARYIQALPEEFGA